MKKFFSLMLALMLLLCSVPALAEMAGGWTIPEDTSMTEEAFDAFYGAVGEESMMFPQIVMGTQVVAGLNYAVLCATDNGAEIAYVYHGVSGENQLMRTQLLLALGDELAGGWNWLLDESAVEVADEAVTAAFEGMTGIGVSEYYILGQQVVAGVNYAVLCRKVTITAEPVEGWALATVYADLEGNVSITDIQDVVLSLSEE